MLKTVETFNELGKGVLEIKDMLLQNRFKKNIYSVIVKGIDKKDYTAEVYSSLVESKCTMEQFEKVLLREYETYTNHKELRALLLKVQNKVSRELRENGHKEFFSDASVANKGVLLIRRMGLNMKSLEREFKLSADEIIAQTPDEFYEAYAYLKLTAASKTIKEALDKMCKEQEAITFTIGNPYFDEDEHFMFNIDISILFKVDEHQIEDMAFIEKNTFIIGEMLNRLKKLYFKVI